MSSPERRERRRPLIRAAVDSDLDAIVRVHNRARPLLADTVAALRSRRTAGVALRDDVPWIRLVAELDGEIVATGRAIEASAGPVAEPGVVYVGIEVDPGVAGRGIGHMLLQHVRDWASALGADRLRCLVDLDDERSVAITRGWGFAASDAEEPARWNYVLDVSRLERARLREMLLPGVEVIPLATRFDDEAFCRAVHDVHDEGRSDIPSTEPFPATVYEDWRAGELRRSGDGGVCLVACREGDETEKAVLGASAAEPVAFVPAAFVDWTVVRRSERRRGVGRMLKAALALWAAERGIDRLDTEVTADNTGMIAVNANVGYRPARGVELFETPLQPDATA
ncbi:MAG TPA: GNAT family N-acetyltransferase [Acidimicrobiia bacterium]|nr:GNAT family N-acetyltransferase [Acidimicrobiia bacterium]